MRFSKIDSALIIIAGLAAGMIAMVLGMAALREKPAPQPAVEETSAPTPAPTPSPIATVTAALSPTPSPVPEDPLAIARRKIESNEIDAAKSILRSFLDANPASAKAASLLALAQIRANELPEATSTLVRVAAMDAALPELPFYQGHLDMVKGDFEGARRNYDEALKRRPADAGVLTARSTARFHLGECAGAIDDASNALKSDPNAADALFARAAAYERMEQHPQALRDYTAFLALRPSDVTGWVNRGKVQLASGFRDAALADWKKAIELAPEMGEKLKPLIEEVQR